MKNFERKIKNALKSSFNNHGSSTSGVVTRGFRDGTRRTQGRPHTYEYTLNDVTVRFCTEQQDAYSWFFPRYAEGRIHERRVTETLIKTIDGAKCFVDIGAYLGWYTCLASKHMPQGKVYGFEMDAINFALLKKNLIINDCKNAEAYNLAVSDSSGMLSYEREDSHPSPILRLSTEEMTDYSPNLITVAAITIDDFFQNKTIKPDVIKIDVEGAETKVLMGMTRLLEKFNPTMFLEIHPANLPLYNSSVSAILMRLMKNEYAVFEIENMRSQNSCMRLNELSPQSVIEENSMILALSLR